MLVVAATGSGHFGSETDEPLWSAIPALIAVTLLMVFGEEYGWRGYLVPKLLPLGEVRASLIVGVIWGVWHFPNALQESTAVDAIAVLVFLHHRQHGAVTALHPVLPGFRGKRGRCLDPPRGLQRVRHADHRAPHGCRRAVVRQHHPRPYRDGFRLDVLAPPLGQQSQGSLAQGKGMAGLRGAPRSTNSADEDGLTFFASAGSIRRPVDLAGLTARSEPPERLSSRPRHSRKSGWERPRGLKLWGAVPERYGFAHPYIPSCTWWAGVAVGAVVQEPGHDGCRVGVRVARLGSLSPMGRGLLIALAVAIVVWLLAIVVLVLLGRRSQASELAALIPNLVSLFRGLLRDPRVPRTSKGWLWFALAWFLSPIDLIPEFIPVVGPLDDAIVAALVLRHVLRRTVRGVLLDHWRGEVSTLDAIVRVGQRKPRDRA